MCLWPHLPELKVLAHRRPQPISFVSASGRPVRKRVKARKRIPSRLRHRNKLNEKRVNEINIPINIEETPRSSNRGRGRGRVRNTIKNVPELIGLNLDIIP